MQPIQVQIVKGPLYKRILNHPFKYYSRMMGTTFCLVTATNAGSVFVDNDKKTFLKEHPEVTALALFTKSAYFGVLWPAFYFTAIMNPRNAFVLWSSMEDANKKL